MGQDLNILKIIWESGFVVKMVLLILIACSIFSWAIIIRKIKTLKLIEAANIKFLEFFKHSSSLREIESVAKDNETSSMAIMFLYGNEELHKIYDQLEKDPKGNDITQFISQYGTVSMERALKQGSNLANEKMDDLLSVLASISSVAPFIGLFGTVWGIINSFTGLASGGGSLEVVAPGIAEALVATAVGLAAAIPANWFYNYFSNRISGINVQMDSFGQEFSNLIERTLFVKPNRR